MKTLFGLWSIIEFLILTNTCDSYYQEERGIRYAKLCKLSYFNTLRLNGGVWCFGHNEIGFNSLGIGKQNPIETNRLDFTYLFEESPIEIAK